MRTFAVLAERPCDQKLEAELRRLRREQEADLRELDQARREMDEAIEAELKGDSRKRWPTRKARRTKTKTD